MANVVLLTKSTDTRNTVTSSNQIYAYQSPDSLDGIPSWIMTKEPNEMYVSGGGASLALPFGSAYSAGTLRIKEFLMRNGHPYSYIDLERDPDVQNLLDTFQISASEDVELALRNPTNQEIADYLGFNESVDQTQVCDLVRRLRNQCKR